MDPSSVSSGLYARGGCSKLYPPPRLFAIRPGRARFVPSLRPPGVRPRSFKPSGFFLGRRRREDEGEDKWGCAGPSTSLSFARGPPVSSPRSMRPPLGYPIAPVSSFGDCPRSRPSRRLGSVFVSRVSSLRTPADRRSIAAQLFRARPLPEPGGSALWFLRAPLSADVAGEDKCPMVVAMWALLPSGVRVRVSNRLRLSFEPATAEIGNGAHARPAASLLSN